MSIIRALLAIEDVKQSSRKNSRIFLINKHVKIVRIQITCKMNYSNIFNHEIYGDKYRTEMTKIGIKMQKWRLHNICKASIASNNEMQLIQD